MPYKDPDKQRQNVADAVRRHRKNKELEIYKKNGKFDVTAYLEDNLPVLMADLLTPGKSIPSEKVKMALKIAEVYKEKQEVTQRFELTTNDRQDLYFEFIERIKRESESTGICPVCQQRSLLRNELLLSPEPEITED